MKKVLIVDDEIEFCMMIKYFLTKKNYEVFVANSLSEGLKRMKSVLPDSLLLDNNLPDGMGWAAAGKIKENYPEMHITLISAHRSVRDLKYHLSSSINILEKPFSLQDIEQYL